MMKNFDWKGTALLVAACAASAAIDYWGIIHFQRVREPDHLPGLTFGLLVLPLFIPRRSFLPATLCSVLAYWLAFCFMDFLDKIELLHKYHIPWHLFGGTGAGLMALFLGLAKIAKPDASGYLLMIIVGAVMMTGFLAPLHLKEPLGLQIFLWQLAVALVMKRKLFPALGEKT